jgi:hypothetical protein
VVWLLVQVAFNPSNVSTFYKNYFQSEVNPGGVKLVIKFHSEQPEAYTEVDEKVYFIVYIYRFKQ